MEILDATLSPEGHRVKNSFHFPVQFVARAVVTCSSIYIFLLLLLLLLMMLSSFLFLILSPDEKASETKEKGGGNRGREAFLIYSFLLSLFYNHHFLSMLLFHICLYMIFLQQCLPPPVRHSDAD